MNIYEIGHQFSENDTHIYFPSKNSSDLFKFFILDDIQFSPQKEIISFLQSELKDSMIESVDFINALFNVPVFSEEFVRILGDQLNNEVTFHTCHLDNKYKFYIARIINKVHLIDYDKSEYMSLTDPEDKPILYNAVYLDDPKIDFFIARDIQEITKYAVSDKFKDLVTKNGMNIKLEKVN